MTAIATPIHELPIDKLNAYVTSHTPHEVLSTFSKLSNDALKALQTKKASERVQIFVATSMTMRELPDEKERSGTASLAQQVSNQQKKFEALSSDFDARKKTLADLQQANAAKSNQVEKLESDIQAIKQKAAAKTVTIGQLRGKLESIQETIRTVGAHIKNQEIALTTSSRCVIQ